jgi:hypothetical protein
MNYTLPNQINQTGELDSLLYYINLNVPIFTPMLLIFIFFVILLAGYFSQERRTGRAMFSQWFAVASFITTVMAIIFLMIPTPIINLQVVLICVVLSIISFAWATIQSYSD